MINKQRDENFNINMAGFLEMIEVIDESPFEFSFADGNYSKNEEHPRMNSLRIKDTSKSGESELSGTTAKTVLKRYVKKI